jgi:hypothetical protein
VKIFVFLVLLASTILMVSSTSDFSYFDADRDAKIDVVPHDSEYVSFSCDAGYSAVVTAKKDEVVSFTAVKIGNYVNEMVPIAVYLYPDLSELPAGMDLYIEDFALIDAGEEYTFTGYLYTNGVADGSYIIPIILVASWEGGGAEISLCPIKIVVESPPKIRKTLIEGCKKVKTHKYYEWVFKIDVYNPDGNKTLTVKDVVPGEFEIDDSRTYASTGNYELVKHGKSTHIKWKFDIEENSHEFMIVTIYTRVNSAGHQEFTSCGKYKLNDGAEIKEYNVVSNPIYVKAVCKK